MGIQKAVQLLRQRRFTAMCLLIAVVSAIAVASSLAGPFGPEKFNYEAEMYYLVAYEPYQNKDVEKAEQLLSKAIKLQPDYADAYILRGTMYGEANQPELAAQYLCKAIELAPDSYIGRYRLAENLVKLDKPDLASKQLHLALTTAEQHKDYFMSARIKSLLAKISDPNAPKR
jgi:predicted Zn-dependent protease